MSELTSLLNSVKNFISRTRNL